MFSIPSHGYIYNLLKEFWSYFSHLEQFLQGLIFTYAMRFKSHFFLIYNLIVQTHFYIKDLLALFPLLWCTNFSQNNLTLSVMLLPSGHSHPRNQWSILAERCPCLITIDLRQISVLGQSRPLLFVHIYCLNWFGLLFPHFHKIFKLTCQVTCKHNIFITTPRFDRSFIESVNQFGEHWQADSIASSALCMNVVRYSISIWS